MLPQATAIAGVAIWFTGMAVLIICWRHLKSQERFLIKTRSTHYMPELSIAVRSGKAYHKATFEHVTDRAVHPVGEVRKCTACRVCLPEAYTLESVCKRKPGCFLCPGITAFAAGIWTSVVFSLYGLRLSGIGFPYAEGKAFRKMILEDDIALVGRRR